MSFISLPGSELQISQEEIAALFDPFVARWVDDANDPEWRAEIAKRKRKIIRKYLNRLLIGWLPINQRRENSIIAEYSKVWQSIDYANYSLVASPPRFSPWEWRGQRMFASTIGATRVRQFLLLRVIEHLRPRSVLEVGCGNGINLLLLACRFPQIEFTGIELTRQGHLAAAELQKLPTLPQPMQDYAPLPLVDPTAFRRIRFLQGNTTSLPFEDGSFDLILTVLALEQMERVRPQALREISRVASQYVLMLEPFLDVNDKGWPYKNVIQRDYFRGRIGDLPDYALEPTVIFDDFPQETFLHTCAVLAKKR